jgi:hypothetical protein
MAGKKSSGINAGLSSIVMVFAVLCLTIFAVLSMVTAGSEKKLVEKSAAAVENYYAADSECEETLGEIYEAWKGCSSLEDVKTKLAGMDKMPEDLYMTIENGRLYISYSQSVDENQSLQVGLAADTQDFQIKAWQLARTGEWNIDEHIHVWGDNQ